MQTFLPYGDVRKSFECLDNKRLGKQRVEAFQILNIILKRTNGKGWVKHPAVLMWKNYPNALKFYLNESIAVWTSRGFRNSMSFEKIRGRVVFPPWFGNAKFHRAHRSNLLRKDFQYYSKFGWKETPYLPYLWPTKI